MTNIDHKIKEAQKNNLESLVGRTISINPIKAIKYSVIGTATGTTIGVATDLFLYCATKGEWNLPIATLIGSTGGCVTGSLSYFGPIHNEGLKQYYKNKNS